MASNKVKFKMSIKEISFEFEGHYEQSKALQQGISQALTGISNLQNQATGAHDSSIKSIEGKVTGTAPLTPRRRRRRNTKASDAHSNDSVTDTTLGEELPFENDKGASTQQRSTGVSPTALVMGLCDGGFFNTRRTSGDVKNELHRKGFSNIKPSDLTSPLITLTRQSVLRRDKDSQLNQWIYTTDNVSRTE